MSKSTGILTVRLPRDEIAAGEEQARQRGMTLSEYVRVIYRRAVRGAIRIARKDDESAVNPRMVA